MYVCIQLLSVFYFKTCFIHYVDFCSFMYMMTFYVLPMGFTYPIPDRWRKLTRLLYPYLTDLFIYLRATTPEHQRPTANPLNENKCQVNGHTPETIQEFGTWSGYQTFHDPIRDQTSMETDMFSCDDYELKDKWHDF